MNVACRTYECHADARGKRRIRLQSPPSLSLSLSLSCSPFSLLLNLSLSPFLFLFLFLSLPFFLSTSISLSLPASTTNTIETRHWSLHPHIICFLWKKKWHAILRGIILENFIDEPPPHPLPSPPQPPLLPFPLHSSIPPPQN